MMLPALRQERSPNLVSVWVDGVRYWFSFESCIAFRVSGEERVISENVWSAKTGRHLNLVGPKSDRIPHEEFLRRLEQVQARRLTEAEAARGR